MTSCWNKDSTERPSFRDIVSTFDDIIIDSVIDDALGGQLWKKQFAGQDSVEWKEFVKGIYEFFQSKSPFGQREEEEKLRAFHSVAVDSDEVVTIENFDKLLKWFGPLKNISIIDEIYNLVNQM